MQLILSSRWYLEPLAFEKYYELYMNHLTSTRNISKGVMQEVEEWKPKIVNSIAIVPVSGIVMRYADSLNPECGMFGTPTGLMNNTLMKLLENDKIKAIVLQIDSPGGEATGIHELVKNIKAGSEIKPIIAHVDGTCASAAYWIASACNKIYMTETSFAGSIGAVCACKKQDDQIVTFVSSSSKNKRPDLETVEGRNVIQEQINDLADIFIASVAKNRGMSIEDVVKKGNYGDSLIAKKALKQGLIDGICSFDAVLKNIEIKEDIMDPKIPLEASNEPKKDIAQAPIQEKLAKKELEVSSNNKTLLESMNAEQRIFVEKLLADNEKHQKALSEQVSALQKYQFMTKAKEFMPHMAGTDEEKGNILMALEKLDSATKEYVYGAFQYVNKHNLELAETKSVKTDQPAFNPVLEKDKWAETKAEELMKTQKMSRSQALVEAYQLWGIKNGVE